MTKFFVLISLSLLSLFATAKEPCIENYSVDEVIHISRIDLNCPHIQLVASSVVDKGLTVSEFAAKYQTAVAINGSFFRKDLSPIGLNISQYKLWTKARDSKTYSFFACTAQNQCHIDPKNHVAAINRQWHIAVAGWQIYNNKSKKFECAKTDRIGCQKDIFTAKHPRTMIGLNEQKNWLYLVVVEGRQLTYRGMTMDELAQLATKLQLTKALNLDGGGSSTMVIGQQRVSALPLLQVAERNVANHFGVRLQKE